MRLHLRAAALLSVLVMGTFLPKIAGAQDLKIAVVDIEALTLNSDEGKAVNDKVKKKYDEISGVMEKLQKDITDKENQIKTAGRAMSEAAKNNLTRDIDALKVSFDRKNQDYQKEITDYQNDLLDPVANKAQAKLKSYIQEKNFSLVVDLSAEKGNVVWVNLGNDITLDLIKQLNDDLKKAPAATAPAAAPRTPATAAPKPPATATPAPGAK
jgi:Skp family chaperone for outer membrane proteins